MVEDGVNGRVYTKGDGTHLEEILLGLARNPGKRHAMGQNARTTAETLFSFSRMVSDYEILLRCGVSEAV
jgi:hypothetical protein